MSTDYRLLKPVSACDLFDGRLEEFGVREIVPPKPVECVRVLTDGNNYLQVYIDDAGLVGCISRYGANAPSKILNAVADAFDVRIVGEYEPQFWGFDTGRSGMLLRQNGRGWRMKNILIEVLKVLQRGAQQHRPRHRQVTSKLKSPRS